MLLPAVRGDRSSPTSSASELFGARHRRSGSPPAIALRDPRLGARARPRPRRRPGAVPPHGPGDGRHGRLPDPAASFLVVALLVALRVAGLDPRTLAVGGAFTAVVLGLAAQQTLGNLIAGTGAAQRAAVPGRRPRAPAGRRRRRPGRGRRRSLGLLYTTFAQGEDSIMVPNNVVLVGGRRAAARARRGRPARPPAPRRARRATSRSCSRTASTTPTRARPAHRARGDRRRRGRRPHRRRRPSRPPTGPQLADEVLPRAGRAATAPRRRATTAPRRAGGRADRLRRGSALGRAWASRRRQRPAAIVVCRRSGRLTRAERARARAPRARRQARSPQRIGDVDLGAVALDRLDDGVARRRPGVRVPT